MKSLLSIAFIVLFGLQATAQPVADKIAAVQLVMAAYGYSYADTRYCSLLEGGQCYFDRSFLGGSDYLVMAVSEDGVYDLDLFAYDSSGRRYSEDTTMGEYPTLSFHKYMTGSLSIYAKNVDSYNRAYNYRVAIVVGYK